MQIISAGIIMYRRRDAEIEVFLVHPGGPFWKGKDLAAWSIPKGISEPGENPLEAAIREFSEETGYSVSGNFIPLTPIKVSSGKVVMAWAIEGDCDPDKIQSNNFTLEWPPHSGRFQEFPEVDRAAWFDLEEANKKIHKGQSKLIEELKRKLIQ